MAVEIHLDFIVRKMGRVCVVTVSGQGMGSYGQDLILVSVGIVV